MKRGRVGDLSHGISADMHPSDQRQQYQQQQDNNKHNDDDDGRFRGVGSEDMGVMSMHAGMSRKVHVERRINTDRIYVNHDNDNNNNSTTATTTTINADSTTSHVPQWSIGS